MSDARYVNTNLKIPHTLHLKHPSQELLVKQHHSNVQILGIRPYESFPDRDTRTLAKDILKSIKAPLDSEIEREYVRNLALLVSRA